MIESRFNRRLIWNSLVVILLGLSTMTLPSLFRSMSWLVLVVVGCIFLIVILGYLCWLKTITVWQDQLEVRHAFLPFVKHTYWLREFEYFEVEQEWKWKAWHETLSLVRNGQRAVTLSSLSYANYQDLKQALAVIGQQRRNDSDVRAVDSVFVKSYLASVLAILFFVILGIAIPIAEYIEEGHISTKSIVLGSAISSFFLLCFISALYPLKKMSVWRGCLEVKRLVWPFHVRNYPVCDLNVAIEVVTPLQFGEYDKTLWLFRNGKLEVSISRAIYANYDALVNAMEVIPYDTVTMSSIKKLQYYLGKSLEL